MQKNSKIKSAINLYLGLSKEIYILALARVIVASGALVGPMMSFFLTIKLGYSDNMVAILAATVTIISLPASLIGGMLADKVGRKKVIVTFESIVFILYIIAALIPASNITVILLYVSGIMQTIAGPANDALIADFSLPHNRDKAYALTYLGYNIGFIFGSIIGGMLFNSYFYISLLINGGVILISVLLVTFFIFEKNSYTNKKVDNIMINEYEEPIDQELNAIKALKGKSVIIMFLLTACLGGLLYNIVQIILPLQLKSIYGEDSSKLYGILGSVNGLVVILFTPVFTILAKKIMEIPKVMLGLLLNMVSIIVFGFFGGIIMMFVGETIFTLGEVASTIGRSPYTSKRIPASHRGRISATFGVVSSIITALSQFGTSFLLESTKNNYTLIWLIYLGIGVFCIISYSIIYKFDKVRFPKLYQ